ncbi:MAG TPA: CapA family protein [Rugosimonospora sp.]|nr:CapA family protein [Rugosimonospora sp.]
MRFPRPSRRAARPAVATALVAALVAAVLAGCTPAAPHAAFSPGPSAPAGSPTASPSASPASRDITLAVAGDVHFTGRTASLLKDPATAFGSIAATLREPDLTVLNLETAITTRGTEQPKEYHFRAPATAFDALRAAGVDAVTLANNHVLDYGQVGLADTLAAAQAAHFPYFGIGVNADAAWAPLVLTVAGTRFAFIGVSQVHDLASSWVATDTRAGEANAIDEARTLAAIRAARSRADVVVVFMHWGTEGNGCPNSEQKSLAGKMSSAGADIILGAHAHVLQGSGWLGNTFVAYGMGNFLWYGTSHSTQTGVLVLTLHPGAPLTTRFLPAVVSATGQPVLLTGSAKTSAEKHYADLRGCTGLTAAPGRTP